MTNELQEKIEYARNIKPHLAALSRLVGRPVCADELLDLASTRQLRERLRLLPRAHPKTVALPFAAMRTEQFKRFVNALASAAPQSVQIWTSTAEACGPLTLDSILNFNFDFDFEDEPGGIIVLRTADLLDRLLLDFSEEDGELELEAEWSGPRWGAVEYQE